METKQYQRKTKNRKSNKKGIVITQKLFRNCAVCVKPIIVTLRGDKIQRGGYYFGKIGISSKREWDRVLKLGTRKSRLFGKSISILKEDPKPYKYVEYWECPKCFK